MIFGFAKRGAFALYRCAKPETARRSGGLRALPRR